MTKPKKYKLIETKIKSTFLKNLWEYFSTYLFSFISFFICWLVPVMIFTAYCGNKLTFSLITTHLRKSFIIFSVVVNISLIIYFATVNSEDKEVKKEKIVELEEVKKLEEKLKRN